MTPENPTGDAGASITDRLESYLADREQPGEQQQRPQRSQSEPPKEERQAPPDNEAEAPEETEVESTESDAPEEGSEPQISLSDLAKYLGVDESALDVDDDGSVKVKTKIDGKEGAAKFQDLLKSYQLQGHVDAKAREAAETQRALQERVSQFEAFAQNEAQRLSQLANIANQELMGEFGNIDWQTLARTDPAEYVARQAEFSTRQARVNQLFQAAEMQNSQLLQAQQYRQQQFIQSEAERLPTLIPEWADGTKAQKERAELRSYAKNLGFSDDDLAGLHRADMVNVLRKAWLYDQGKAKATIAEKQVRSAPKLVKPGQSVDTKQRASEGLRDLKASIRKSGGKTGVAEYLMRSGKV